MGQTLRKLGFLDVLHLSYFAYIVSVSLHSIPLQFDKKDLDRYNEEFAGRIFQ